MLALFNTLINLFRSESPQERYERLCYEAEQEEKKDKKTHSKE